MLNTFEIYLTKQFLEFGDELEASSFISMLINFFQTNQVTYQESDVSMSQLQQQAVTKAQRDEQLKKFFKSALETVCFSIKNYDFFKNNYQNVYVVKESNKKKNTYKKLQIV